MPFTVSHLNQLISVVSVQFCWLLHLLLLSAAAAAATAAAAVLAMAKRKCGQQEQSVIVQVCYLCELCFIN